MDIRSFVLNLEVSLMVCNPDFIWRMRTVEQEYQQASREVDVDRWLDRPWAKKYLDNVSRLAAALL